MDYILNHSGNVLAVSAHSRSVNPQLGDFFSSLVRDLWARVRVDMKPAMLRLAWNRRKKNTGVLANLTFYPFPAVGFTPTRSR